jgi:hypothetical protein
MRKRTMCVFRYAAGWLQVMANSLLATGSMGRAASSRTGRDGGDGGFGGWAWANPWICPTTPYYHILLNRKVEFLGLKPRVFRDFDVKRVWAVRQLEGRALGGFDLPLTVNDLKNKPQDAMQKVGPRMGPTVDTSYK